MGDKLWEKTWSSGVLEWWSIAAMEYWSTGKEIFGWDRVLTLS